MLISNKIHYFRNFIEQIYIYELFFNTHNKGVARETCFYGINTTFRTYYLGTKRVGLDKKNVTCSFNFDSCKWPYMAHTGNFCAVECL